MAAERVDVEEVPGPTPPGRLRRIRLETVDDVRVELARLYREVRAGDLDPALASKLTYMLVSLARVAEVATVERRLAEIERQLQDNASAIRLPPPAR
jgi:hypothetical protein